MNPREQITAGPRPRVVSPRRPRVLLIGGGRHLGRVRSRLAELGFACSTRTRAPESQPELPEDADAILLVSRFADRDAVDLHDTTADGVHSRPIFAVPAVSPDPATTTALRESGVAGVFAWPRDLRALESSLVRLLHDRCGRPPADVALEERLRAEVRRRLPSVESKRVRVHARDGDVSGLGVRQGRPHRWSH